MNNLFDKWKTRKPNYDKKYKDSLMTDFTDYGGRGNQEQKPFDSAYELYIYSFFIGLYNDNPKPIQNKTNFGHEIEAWGLKSTKIGRQDYSIIQKYIFAALIAKTDIDMLALEKGTVSEDEIVSQLIDTMEQYTNGGMALIRERLEDNPNYFYSSDGFLKYILEATSE